jgi:hypothetical protein
VHDLNGDGRPEIIASGNHVDELSELPILVNRGDGTFAAAPPVETGLGETLQDAGDLNGDGVADLLASNFWGNGLSVYRGRGSLQFEQPDFRETATHGGPSWITDYDGDGLPDLVSLSFGSGNPVRVHLFRGRHDGTLAPRITFETGFANGASPSLRRINGSVELLVAEHSAHLGLFRLTAGGISIRTIPISPDFDLSCTFADVNGDGVADIIDTTDGELGTEQLFVTIGTADGGFGQRRQIEQPRHVAFPDVVHGGDMDGDGNLDLIVSDFRMTSLYLFRGDGTGRFEEGAALDAGGPVNDFKIADLNGDGRLDVVTANNDHSISVLINNGPSAPPRRRAISR